MRIISDELDIRDFFKKSLDDLLTEMYKRGAEKMKIQLLSEDKKANVAIILCARNGQEYIDAVDKKEEELDASYKNCH
ncbi:hypothetical protein KCM76_22800 [Zooshikella marina]|uniref:hypothetical protein n=1 Tax=Zooshikella ganghwensis TaxID=202772 RepID=UPI001BB01552|nr:hypothetical protein [Zooshikella ganghwensis]MBU2708841.1 hypothetical protein [Zooshikella ganghwensis]